MMLCLDVGNTQIYGGVFNQEGKVVQNFRLTTSTSKTSDELGLFLKSVLVENDIDIKEIKKVGICSVVPHQDYSLRNAILKYFKTESFFLEAGVKTGIKLKSPNPKEVGADRIANAIAATHLFEKQNIIVIDFGTATTIDVITADKEYLGGVILAGIRLNAEALGTKTAKLTTVQIQQPDNVVGRTTIECIQSGLFYGTLGAIKEINARIRQESFPDQDVKVIATGGLASLYRNNDIFEEELPDLVLQGLRFCYLKNI